MKHEIFFEMSYSVGRKIKGDEKMKVTVLGFWGGYPEAGEATSGYLLEQEGYRLLVDCGSGVLSQLQEHMEIEELDGVILSHYHHDHIADIGVLQYARQILTLNGVEMQELPIYGHEKDEKHFTALTHGTYTKGVGYAPEKELKVGPFTITFKQTVHPVVCYAMRIEAGNAVLTYTADSSYEESFSQFAQNSNLFIVDCNGYAHQDMTKAGHMTSRECGKLAAQAGAKTLLLSHLPHFGDTSSLIEEAEKEFQGEVVLAETGLTFELGE